MTDKATEYVNIFYDRLNFGFLQPTINQFNSKHYNDIEPNIRKILAFVEECALIPNEFKEDIKRRCICLLPFLLIYEILCKKSDSTAYMKKINKQTVELLKFIKHNKRHCNSLFSNITSDKNRPQIDKIVGYDSDNNPITKKEFPSLSFNDIIGLDIEKIDKELEFYSFMSNTKTRQREWYSNLMEFHFLLKGLEITKIKPSHIAEFISDFTKQYPICHITKLSIQKKYLPYKKHFKDHFVNLNPYIKGIIPPPK